MASYCNHHEVAQEPYLSIEIFKDCISHQRGFDETIWQTFKGHHKRAVHQQWRHSSSCSSLCGKAISICSSSSTHGTIGKYSWSNKWIDWVTFENARSKVFHSMQKLSKPIIIGFLIETTLQVLDKFKVSLNWTRTFMWFRFN
jgi:hypothetical protein